MNALAFLKVGGGVVTVLAVLAVVWLWRDHQRLAGLQADHRACLAAVNGERGSKPLTVCDGAILAAAEGRDRARACDAALAAEPENAFGIQQACSAPVKRLVADRDAARQERDGDKADLSKLQREQAGAIARAEARGLTQAQRIANAQVVISAQPRGDDGLLLCADDCLRQLSEGSAADAGGG